MNPGLSTKALHGTVTVTGRGDGRAFARPPGKRRSWWAKPDRGQVAGNGQKRGHPARCKGGGDVVD